MKSRWKIDFKELYSGKIALEDYFREDVRGAAKTGEVYLPVFMSDMELYRKALDNIAKTNGIEF